MEFFKGDFQQFPISCSTSKIARENARIVQAQFKGFQPHSICASRYVVSARVTTVCTFPRELAPLLKEQHADRKSSREGNALEEYHFVNSNRRRTLVRRGGFVLLFKSS